MADLFAGIDLNVRPLEHGNGDAGFDLNEPPLEHGNGITSLISFFIFSHLSYHRFLVDRI